MSNNVRETNVSNVWKVIVVPNSEQRFAFPRLEMLVMTSEHAMNNEFWRAVEDAYEYFRRNNKDFTNVSFSNVHVESTSFVNVSVGYTQKQTFEMLNSEKLQNQKPVEHFVNESTNKTVQN